MDSRIASLAATQGGWIPRVDLRRSGVSRGAILRRLESGLLVEAGPGLYRLGAAPAASTRDDQMHGALLCFQRYRPVLSHLTAAGLMRLWDRGSRARIDVLVPDRVADPRISWIRVHRTDDLAESDRADDGRHPMTGLIRTMLDCASELTEFQLTRLYHEAEFRYGVDLERVEERNRLRWRWPYSAVVRAAIEHRRSGSVGTRSATEDHLLAGIIRAQLPIPAICNPTATGVAGEECDMVWSSHRLVVEIDGTTVHGRRGDDERDLARDAALAKAGWRVVRFSSEDVWNGREEVVSQIARQLGT